MFTYPGLFLDRNVAEYVTLHIGSARRATTRDDAGRRRETRAHRRGAQFLTGSVRATATREVFFRACVFSATVERRRECLKRLNDDG